MRRRTGLAWTGCLWGLFCAANPLAVTAQVFVPGPSAESGVVTPGTGEGYYGSLGLDASANLKRAYSNYRRLDGLERPGTKPEIQSLSPVAGNPTAALWQGLDHGGSGTLSGYHDPGMFLGNSNARYSYYDQLLYFGATKNGTSSTDPDGGVGGDNLPNGTKVPDSNGRVNWEVSVGFLEDIDSYMDGRPPNSNRMDLWDGVWNTDGVQMRLYFTASNSPELSSSDWFSFQESMGDGKKGLRAQSGIPDTRIRSEVDRDVYPSVRRRVGSAATLGANEGFLAGGSDGRAVHVGVSYLDEMELSWRMEPNDPSSSDPKKAREVRFVAKTGNLEYVSVFDPGAPNAAVVPNPTKDPGITWEKGYFDWRKSTPVFYLGLDKGTDYGKTGATGLMGIYEPGDFNADGKVNATDRGILQANQGMTSSSYSRGDLDQDGDTDGIDLLAWESLGDPASQIDSIRNLSDRVPFVHNMVRTYMGDSNLDGEFNSNDFVMVFQKGQYEDATVGNSRWADGDWSGDYDFNTADFVVAFQDGGFENGPLPALAAVPEPSACCLMFLGWTAWWAQRRPRCAP